MKKKGEDSYIKFTQIYSTPWSSKNHFPQYDDSQNAKIYISKLQYDPLLETPKKLKQIQNLQMDIERVTNRKYVHETGPCHLSYTQNPPQPHMCKHASSTWSKGCIVGQASSVSCLSALKHRAKYMLKLVLHSVHLHNSFQSFSVLKMDFSSLRELN